MLLRVAAASAVLLATTLAFHDPRSDKPDLSASVNIKGHGEVVLTWKALHFNAARFEDAKKDDSFLTMLNTLVWGDLGTADADYDVKLGDQTLKEGHYRFGVNMTKDEKFSLVFRTGPLDAPTSEVRVPLVASMEKSAGLDFLAIAILGTAEPDHFTIEARCGHWVGTCAMETTLPKEDAK